jgi:porin
MLYQWADDSPADSDDVAGSGIFRVFGRWTLLGRGKKNTGSLVFSVDHRHTLGTDIPPSDFGFEIGYLGIPGVLFSDAGLILVDLNWQHAFNFGRTGLIAGRYDPNDYFDILGYANPWRAFQNLSILLNSSIALPDASIGIGAGHFITDQVYVLGMVNDANGTVTDLDIFKYGAEFFKAIEFGWTPSRDRRYFNQVHVTGWHVDEREDAGVPESWGFTLASNWSFNDKWLPFIKAGWSDGEAPLMNASVTMGVVYFIARHSDLVGFGFNWGNPADSTLRDQYTSELFYRLQLAENLEVTPSVQLLLDPALNPEDDVVWIGGLRIRLSI